MSIPPGPPVSPALCMNTKVVLGEVKVRSGYKCSLKNTLQVCRVAHVLWVILYVYIYTRVRHVPKDLPKRGGAAAV